MMAGRTLMRELIGKEKFVITGQLLLGTDGRKMSKSYNNYVGISDTPKDMYGKIMSIQDELIEDYFKLCTSADMGEINEIHLMLAKGSTNPRDFKMQLAKLITREYHGDDASAAAEAGFISQFQKGIQPADIPELNVGKPGNTLVDVLMATDMAGSRGEAKRLIQQGGVKINGKPSGNEPNQIIEASARPVLQVGKLKYVRVLPE